MVYPTERQFKQQGQCLSEYFLSLFLQKKPSEVFCKKKVFLKISQYSQENTSAGVSF